MWYACFTVLHFYNRHVWVIVVCPQIATCEIWELYFTVSKKHCLLLLSDLEDILYRG